MFGSIMPRFWIVAIAMRAISPKTTRSPIEKLGASGLGILLDVQLHCLVKRTLKRPSGKQGQGGSYGDLRATDSSREAMKAFRNGPGRALTDTRLISPEEKHEDWNRCPRSWFVCLAVLRARKHICRRANVYALSEVQLTHNMGADRCGHPNGGVVGSLSLFLPFESEDSADSLSSSATRIMSERGKHDQNTRQSCSTYFGPCG